MTVPPQRTPGSRSVLLPSGEGAKTASATSEIDRLKFRVQELEALLNSERQEQVEQAALASADPQFDATEAHYRLLVESIQDYEIVMLDPEGRITSWNKGAVRITGYQAEEVLGRHFSLFYCPDEIADGKPARQLQEAAAQGRFEEEGRRIRKNGEVYWSLVVMTALRDDRGVLCGFAKVTRDITERKQSEEQALLMAELAMNAMVLVDQAGRILHVNSQTEKLFGYSKDELLGQKVEALIPETYRREHPAQRERFFANPSVRAMGAGRDLRARRKDGSEFPVEIALNPVHTGSELLVIGSVIDITERKLSEERAQKHLSELAHAGRLSTLGELFSELAHEINQPLAAAANYARAAVRLGRSDEGTTKEQLTEWMEKAAGQAERASQIVKRLGGFLKKGKTTRFDLNLNQLIESIIALPTLLISASSDNVPFIRLELQADLPQIMGDKVQIEQVLVNLIRNSIEAMHNIPAADRRLIVQTRRMGDCVLVTVADSGPGLPVEQQQQLFQPFFTTKAEGMGLGLSVSRSIIEAHHGRLFLEHSSPQGTAMAFQLPIKTREDP